MYNINDKVITTDDKVGIIRSIKTGIGGTKIAEIELTKDGTVIHRYLEQILRIVYRKHGE